MSVERWWNVSVGHCSKDTECENESTLVNLLQCLFIHHKFHKILLWKGIRPSILINRLDVLPREERTVCFCRLALQNAVLLIYFTVPL